MARIWVEAYGCSASFADSEMIAGLVANGGHTLASDSQDADLSIIVTCSVKDATANRMIHRMRALNSRPLIVAGCLPKAEPKTVQKMARGASMLGPNSLGETLRVVNATLGGQRLVALADTDVSKTEMPRIRLNEAVGIIEIAKGCMSECTFCQTKLAKGDLQSYRPGDIIRQMMHEVDDGCKEIWLTSTDNGCYGLDIGTSLPELMDSAARVRGDFMIRVGMMNPMYMPRIRDALMDAYNSDKIYKFIHVPVQAGSRRVLNEMKRGHTADTFRGVTEEIRRRFSRFTISTDVIVGFPSETCEEFEETMSVIRETRPDIVNISRYSRRPGTPAAGMEQVDVAEVKRRSREATELVNSISLENNQKWLGWRGKACFTEMTQNGTRGRNFAYKPIFTEDDVSVGQTCQVEITGATTHALVCSVSR